MNVINFKSRGNLRVKGDILINGIRADASKMAQISCFVRQDDLFFQKLRVEEHLMLQVSFLKTDILRLIQLNVRRFCHKAILRLSKKVTSKQKVAKVKEALKEFQLDVCKSAYIMNISGGQKRRLSCATEVCSPQDELLLTLLCIK